MKGSGNMEVTAQKTLLCMFDNYLYSFSVILSNL